MHIRKQHLITGIYRNTVLHTLIFLALCMVSISSYAHKKSVQITVFFSVDKSELNSNYMGNEVRLKKMIHLIDSIRDLPEVKVTQISLCGYSSPEGLEAYNNKLSRARMERIKRYLVEQCKLQPEIIQTSYVTENWVDLQEAIQTSDLPHRMQMIDIIESKMSNDRKEFLIKTRYPKEYARLLREVYPELRYARIDFTFEEEEKKIEEKPAPRPETEQVSPPIIIEPKEEQQEIVEVPADTTQTEEPAADDCHEGLRPILAIKTNMLYDLLLAPNLEVERWFGKRHQYSVMAEWMAPWYVWHHNRRAYEILNVGLEGRYWINSNTECHRWLAGWFAGIYLMSGKYDLEWNGKGYQGEYMSPGLTLGFAHRIGKRWNLEYSVGAGYLRTHYRYYEAMFNDQHLIWQHNGRTQYWGLTKAKISLVYFLDENWLKSLFGKKKGGGR